MSEVSELKAQVQRLEALVAKLSRRVDFLHGALDTLLAVEALTQDISGKVTMDRDDLTGSARTYVEAAGFTQRAIGAAVYGYAERTRKPIRRDAFVLGRSAVTKELAKSATAFSKMLAQDDIESPGEGQL